jgi:sugar (pentulose or hexulose) kinase
MHTTNMPLVRRGGIDMVLMYGAQPSRADIARAFVENVAFALRTARTWAAAPIGAQPRVRLGGGVARLRSLARVLAGVINDEVLVAEDPEVTLRGAGAAAAAAAGWYGGLREAAGAFATPLTAVEPECADAYDELYGAWAAAAEERVVARFSDLLSQQPGWSA